VGAGLLLQPRAVKGPGRGLLAVLAILAALAVGCGSQSRSYTASDVQSAFVRAGLPTHVVFTPATKPVGFGSGAAFDGAALKALLRKTHVDSMVAGPETSPKGAGPPFAVTAWIYGSDDDAGRYGPSGIDANRVRRANVVVIAEPRYIKRVRAALASLA
jgi:hypothetical protein